MKSWIVAGVSCLALGAGACQSPQPRAVTRLSCPKTEGRLELASAATDGKSCTYRYAADGAEVLLRLVPVSGGVPVTLAKVEEEVRAMAAAAPVAIPPGAASAPVAEASPRTQADQAAAVAQAQADAAALGGSDGPDAPDDSDDVQVDMPGLHISTRGDDANIKVAGFHVDADSKGAVVRWVKDVRLRGEATSFERRGVRALFILAGPDGPDQISVGYQAAGPKAGPLTVALVRWGSADHEELFSDVRNLVRRNGGA